jgi:hypothetical protein
VTESHSPLDAALDLLLFAPVGLMLTAAEEIPKLAAKGRSQLGGQITMAKAVGQFAMGQGRKELSRRFSGPGHPDLPQTRPPVPAATVSAAADVSFEELLATAEKDSDTLDGQSRSGPAPVGRAGPVGSDAPADPSGPRPSPDGLAIPGYDSLAASQVVQRLAGLSSEELAAVGVYEAAHRGRRTVLTRVRQLQGS